MHTVSLDSLFQPIRLGPVLVRNRVMLSTHGTRLSQVRYLRYIEERVAHGVGLVGLPAGSGVGELLVGPGRHHADYGAEWDTIAPDPSSPSGITYYDEWVTPLLAQQAERVHRHGGHCVGQLHHAGAARNMDNLQPAPGPEDWTEEDIDRLVLAFAEGARRVRDAGIDFVELHAAHGYLLQQFWATGRVDLLYRVLAAVGAPTGVRLDREMLDAAVGVAELGAAYINVSGGTNTGYEAGRIGSAYVGALNSPDAPNVDAAAAMKALVDIPVIASGGIRDPQQAAEIVASGMADMVGMVRAFIAAPKLLSRPDGARCIGGNECHVPGRSVVCAVNPDAGREAELDLIPAKSAHSILVVGAGPAGVEVAWRAAARGHRVTVCDRSDAVGGVINMLARDAKRHQLADYAAHLTRRISELDVRLGVEVTPEWVADLGPDVVVLAVGADEERPLDAVTGLEVLAGEPVGDRVVVHGGGDDHLAPIMISDLLAQAGHHVDLIGEPIVFGEGLDPANRYALTKLLLEAGVVMHPLTRLVHFSSGKAAVANTLTGREWSIEHVDSLVSVAGRRPRTELADGLRGAVNKLYRVGDCMSPRRIVHATLEGARLGCLI